MAEVLEFNDMFYTNFEPKMKWTLKGAFITTAAFGDLDWSSNDPAEITITLSYDYAILEF